MLFNVPQNELIEKTAEELKKLIHMPSWGPFVKTGVHKQRPPVNADWWYVRSASVLRKIYLLGPIGVSKLRTKYGGKKNRGVKPERSYKGSGSIIRKVLQQLEEAKLIKQAVVGKHKGRVITPKGVSLLFSVAKSMGGKISKKDTEAKASEVSEAKSSEHDQKSKISDIRTKSKPPKPQPAKAEQKESPKEEKKERPVIPKEEQLLKAPPAKTETNVSEVQAKPEQKEEKREAPKEEVKEKTPKKEQSPKEEKVEEVKEEVKKETPEKKEKNTGEKSPEVKQKAEPPKKDVKEAKK